MRGAALDGIHERHALPEPRSQERMREIRTRLILRRDGKAPGSGAVAQARDLREDEPHPMAALLARRKLAANLREDRLLRRDEALQIVDVIHRTPSLLDQPRRRAIVPRASGAIRGDGAKI